MLQYQQPALEKSFFAAFRADILEKILRIVTVEDNIMTRKTLAYLLAL